MDEIKARFASFSLNETKNIGPIGPMVDLKNMSNVCGLTSFQDQLGQIGLEIERWRMVLGDGNCFYRAFMFSYLESNILSKNWFELKKFVYDFSKKIDVKFKRKNVGINKFQIISIFNIIFDFLDRNDVKGAYEIFLKSYHIFENFDLVSKEDYFLGID